MASSEQIQEVQLHETTRTRYLNYAMSVITSRALPDVRDGLKPVQRRILYSMYSNLRLTHDSKPRKSAAIVGDVMGKYHPHGDQSIYDAMVRMAQSFSMRYPLVDGHGNFGSLDGDSAAAMRYTEARLDPLAGELLDEIRRDTVDFRDNYDGTEEEPIVVPAQVPNLLINGATGIAVGMATNIPPHNLVECLDACIALIDDPELTVDDLVPKYVKGPDFPTGGVITNTQKEIKKLYVEGSGTVNIRGEWDIEKDGRKKFVVIHSMPYTVNKSSLVEKIADHIVKGNLPQVTDVRDESTGDVRIILELKRGSDVEAAMAYLFKHTKLESRFHVNMTALTPPKEGGDVPAPATLDLKQVLDHFLDFRMEIVERRLRHELRKLERRIHILEGFEIIFDALDKAIELIRSSEGRAEAREKLMDFFELDEDQANAILEIKLYRLAKMEIEAVREELREKRARAEQIRTLLSDEEARWEVIRKELIALKTAYDDPRRTRIDTDVEDFEYTEADYIIDEDVWVMVSRDGWIKLQKSYSDISKIRVRDNDEIGWVLPGRTPQTVMFFTNRGRAYTMRINDVPTTTGHGDPLQAYFDFDDGEKVVGVLTKDDRVLANPSSDQVSLVEDDEETGPQVVAITENGRGVRIAIEDYVDPSTVRGRMFMRLEDDDHVVNVEQFFGLDAEGEDENVALATRDGRGLMFPAREISYYKGIGKGVKAIDLQDDDDVLDWTMTRDKYEGLPVETNQGADHEIRASLSKFAPSSRGNKGHWVIKRGHLVKSLRGPHAVPKDRWDDEE